MKPTTTDHPPRPRADIAATHPAAELDRRFYAFALDRLATSAVLAVVVWWAWRTWLEDGQVAAGLAVIAAAVLATTLALAAAVGSLGVSPGKALLGLQVVRESDGRPLGFAAALVRTLVLGMLTVPTAGLGVVTLAWTAVMDPGGRRRGAHDRMTGAVVVDVRPAPPVVEVSAPQAQGVVNLTALRLTPAGRIDAATVPGSGGGEEAVEPAPTGGHSSAQNGVQPVAPPPARRRSQASATWRVAFDTGEAFVVDGLVLVGRRPEPRPEEAVTRLVPLASSDMSLSKTHAQFQVVPDGALVVMDRGSTNGSIVVRQGVSKPLAGGRPATLLDGDIVRFGDRTMIVTRIGDASEKETSP